MELIQKDMCFGCGACVSTCPNGAVKLIRDKFGFLTPNIDESLCTNCGLCKKKCPAHKPLFFDKSEITTAYSAKSKYSKECASGGVFYTLAKNILNKGGYIAGTIWNNDFCPEIVLTNNSDVLEKMKGSKYVNGGTGNSYKETLEKLNQNHIVLYSGTPCQISGLYSFLGKDYDNLFTVEILCHGGGSPLAWEKYVEFANKKYGKRIIDCKMQNTKDKITLYFSDGTSVIESMNNDNEYFSVYVNGKIKRDTCNICPFMGRLRNSDIIIGDIWAKWAKKKRKDGISLVIPNSEKGMRLLKSVKWEYCAKFDINSKKNKPLNKINNNIPNAHKDRNKILESLANGKSFEETCGDNKVALMNYNYPRDNYGALLLAYAMEQTVKKMGYEPYTINYYKNPITMDFNPQGSMWKFRENFLNLYGFYNKKSELEPLNKDFNKFIFGSDIIWHANRDYVYYADWLYGKKNIIAYAASFCENKMPKKDKYKQYCMKRFDSVSVRESSGVNICKQYADVDAVMAIDPSLLLTKEEYQPIIDKEESTVPDGEYIGYYSFWNMNPYNIDVDLPVYDLFHKNNGEVRSFGQWLNMIKHAKCVVTASFHGVCFSILYNIPFVYIKKPREDNERVKSLLNKLNIDNSCIVESEKGITKELINRDIDWENINSRVQEYREESYRWLKSAIEKEPSNKKKIKSKYKKIKRIFFKIVAMFIKDKEKRADFKRTYLNKR